MKSNQLPKLNIEIPGYHFCDVPTYSIAGGIGVYKISLQSSTKYAFESLNIFGLNHNDCEDIWVQLSEKNKCDRPLVIGAVYRHPRNDVTKFTEILNKKSRPKIH